jgi:hypothetical protein
MFVALGLGAPEGLGQARDPSAWPDFPAFVWRLGAPAAPLPDELALAFGGVNLEGAAEDEWAFEGGLDVYIGHAPGRDALHLDSDRTWYRELWEGYWKERDAEALVRRPCLSEEGTFEQLCETLARSLRARGGRTGLGLSLGDEVGLTPYGAPLDLCASRACRAAFARFVATTEPWRSLLAGAPDGPDFPDTDSTRLAWIDGDPRHVPGWLARRAFHAHTVVDTLERLARRARELAPSARVGLFGQSGRTAFGDVDLPRVLSCLDFIEVYRILDSRELVYSLRDAEQRSLLTLFRDPAAPDGPAWLAWEHWLRGGDGCVLWSDRDLLSDPGYFGRLRDAIADIRSLRRTIPEWRPRPSGVALIHSDDSLALSWLRDALNDGPTWMRRFPSYQNEHGTRELSLRALLRALEDAGLLPGALPLADIDGSTAARFPLLIANHLILLDADELARLKAFVGAGGELRVVGGFGDFDRRGARRAEDEALERVDGGTGRARRLELDPQRYLRERWGPAGGSAHARELRVRLRAQCGAARPQEPPWSLAGDPGPWLRATQATGAPGVWLCAALPNAEGPAERAGLAGRELRIVVEEGVRVERLHPPPVAAEAHDRLRLRAGDALVFRLVRP